MAILTFEKTSLKVDDLVETEKGRLSSILSKIDIIAGTLASNNAKLGNAIANFSNISDTLAKSNLKGTIENASIALGDASKIMQKISKGEGSMGMLINDDSLYKRLDNSSRDLDSLLVDIKAHPKRYLHFSVFGNKDKKK